MPHFEVRIVAEPDELDALPALALYEAVGWTSYTRDPATLAAVEQRYVHVRQHVLLTDDEAGQRAFYESRGYAETRDFGQGTLRAFVRFM